jgi:hypothetical protein
VCVWGGGPLVVVGVCVCACVRACAHDYRSTPPPPPPFDAPLAPAATRPACSRRQPLLAAYSDLVPWQPASEGLYMVILHVLKALGSMLGDGGSGGGGAAAAASRAAYQQLTGLEAGEVAEASGLLRAPRELARLRRELSLHHRHASPLVLLPSALPCCAAAAAPAPAAAPLGAPARVVPAQAQQAAQAARALTLPCPPPVRPAPRQTPGTTC